jgi:hydroxymethylpyrimidine/phosphomethylpyrimidine kinase
VKWITGEEIEEKAANELAKHCDVFLKGGHRTFKKGVDFLYESKGITEFLPTKASTNSKHGTGCVLSAAIASNLALGLSLSESCRRGKAYLEKVLDSNHTLLGYHHV